MKSEPLAPVVSPKIVLWDIETTHNLIAKFNLREEYIPFENVLQERYVVCAAWKTLGQRSVDAVSVLDDAARYHDGLKLLLTENFAAQIAQSALKSM